MQPRGAALAGELGGEQRAVYVRCDVTQEPDVEAAVGAAVQRFGRLDIMCNNAGAVLCIHSFVHSFLLRLLHKGSMDAPPFLARLCVPSVSTGGRALLPLLPLHQTNRPSFLPSVGIPFGRPGAAARATTAPSPRLAGVE